MAKARISVVTGKKKRAGTSTAKTRVKHTVRKVASAITGNRVEADKLVRDVRARKAQVERDFYEMGKALEKLSEPRLYTALGYRTFDDLLRRERLMSRTTAYRVMSVVQSFSKRDAQRVGLDKAFAITRYAHATPDDDLARTLLREDATIDGKRISQLSARQIKQAAATTRKAAGTRRKKKAAAQVEAERTARELQRHLRAKGAKGLRVMAVRDAGEWRLRVELDVEQAGYLR